MLGDVGIAGLQTPTLSKACTRACHSAGLRMAARRRAAASSRLDVLRQAVLASAPWAQHAHTHTHTHLHTWSKFRSSQGLPGWKGPVRVKGFQMGSVRPTSW